MWCKTHNIYHYSHEQCVAYGLDYSGCSAEENNVPFDDVHDEASSNSDGHVAKKQDITTTTDSAPKSDAYQSDSTFSASSSGVLASEFQSIQLRDQQNAMKLLDKLLLQYTEVYQKHRSLDALSQDYISRLTELENVLESIKMQIQKCILQAHSQPFLSTRIASEALKVTQQDDVSSSSEIKSQTSSKKRSNSRTGSPVLKGITFNLRKSSMEPWKPATLTQICKICPRLDGEDFIILEKVRLHPAKKQSVEFNVKRP